MSRLGVIMTALNKSNKLTYKKGLKDGLPIGLGYFSVSLAFGVQASLLGLPVLLTVLISMTNLTSAGQLAGLEIIVSAGAFTGIATLVVEMILSQVVINARYFLMSLTLSQKLDTSFSFPKRLLCSTFITDEIFAVGASQKILNTKYFLGLSTLPYFGWALGTLVGALAGSLLPPFISNALGIALYAMFIAIIIPPSTKDKGVFFVLLISAGISCLFYYLPVLHDNVSMGFAVIICAVVSAVIMALIRPIKEEENELP